MTWIAFDPPPCPDCRKPMGVTAIRGDLLGELTLKTLCVDCGHTCDVLWQPYPSDRPSGENEET